MMEIYLKKTQGVLTPAYSTDQEQFSTLKNNTIYRAKIVKPRHPEHHQLVMALCNAVVHNDRTGLFPTVKSVLNKIKLNLGYIEGYQTIDEKVVVILKSISFDAMDQTEFQEFWNKALPIVARLLGVTEYQLRDNYKEYFEAVYG